MAKEMRPRRCDRFDQVSIGAISAKGARKNTARPSRAWLPPPARTASVPRAPGAPLREFPRRVPPPARLQCKRRSRPELRPGSPATRARPRARALRTPIPHGRPGPCARSPRAPPAGSGPPHRDARLPAAPPPPARPATARRSPPASPARDRARSARAGNRRVAPRSRQRLRRWPMQPEMLGLGVARIHFAADHQRLDPADQRNPVQVPAASTPMPPGDRGPESAAYRQRRDGSFPPRSAAHGSPPAPSAAPAPCRRGGNARSRSRFGAECSRADRRATLPAGSAGRRGPGRGPRTRRSRIPDRGSASASGGSRAPAGPDSRRRAVRRRDSAAAGESRAGRRHGSWSRSAYRSPRN